MVETAGIALIALPRLPFEWLNSECIILFVVIFLYVALRFAKSACFIIVVGVGSAAIPKT